MTPVPSTAPAGVRLAAVHGAGVLKLGAVAFVSVSGAVWLHVEDLLHAFEVEEPLLPLFKGQLFLVIRVLLEYLIH